MEGKCVAIRNILRAVEKFDEKSRNLLEFQSLISLLNKHKY